MMNNEGLRFLSSVGTNFLEAKNWLFSVAKDLAVPSTCLMCERIVAEQGACCPHCWNAIRFISKPYCEIMGTPFSHDLGKGVLSADAIANPPAFERARSVVLYDDKMRRLVSNFKYSDRTELGPWVANWMVRAGRELFEHSPTIIPVPLHKARMIGRRYNQSAELSRHISKKIGCDYDPLSLLRIRNTNQQVRLSSVARVKNVQGAFRVSPERQAYIKGKDILLIDDVLTTGATVNAASKALKRAGARRVDVLTFARVEIFDI